MIVVQLSDLHVRPKGRPCNRVIETNALTERAFRAVSRLPFAPDAVLLTGDLADCGLPEEYAELKSLIDRYLPAGKTHAIPGNHDRRDNLIAALGAPLAPTGFVDYIVELADIRVVMLDSVAPGSAHGELRHEQLDWLDASLNAARKTPTMIALHHPPFLTGIGHMDAIALKVPEGLAAVVGRHPQVQRVVCGHLHRQITARLAQATATSAPSVGVAVALDLQPGGPSAFVKEPPAFSVHRWTGPSGFVTHNVFVDDYDGPYPFIMEPEYPGSQN